MGCVEQEFVTIVLCLYVEQEFELYEYTVHSNNLPTLIMIISAEYTGLYNYRLLYLINLSFYQNSLNGIELFRIYIASLRQYSTHLVGEDCSTSQNIQIVYHYQGYHCATIRPKFEFLSKSNRV